ncbi:MAG: glycosyltransferase [Proteobacteria bacterium]|nr:glycosyltransferase [Desulfobacterales bacterium]MBL7102623.1 glycosyltransferase [Desulfobacteraceae bacterium]MBL7173816.1 glycosyltransferase [Desulfobacteraceae bacterium]MBU0734404.1 glycosyltransferase [Pseudomonadota bacterium]MBU1904304.1 glycosyltransferase [Pseudomonadota bacterium]
MTLTYLAVIGACIWTAILLLPWRPWATSEVLDASTDLTGDDLGDITVLIPARNEAGTIETTLAGIKDQGEGLHVILVDDRSSDGTARKARAIVGDNLHIIPGKPLPDGWSGKLWALEQGLGHVDSKLLLLLDADIALKPGILQALRRKLEQDGLQLISLMAALRMEIFWERLLMPAFIYFFKMLYPFRLSNSRFPWVAAAAGGCILLKTDTLREIGGFGALRNELIDDCALARRFKTSGFRTWIGLSHAACSLRPYEHLKTIWDMVARTAFNQLRYSALLLFLCTIIMMILFWFPFTGLFLSSTLSKIISAWAIGTMVLTYLPTLRFYGLSMGWAIFLPLIGTLYLAMTWTSAIRFWQGKGSVWKGRSYRS